MDKQNNHIETCGCGRPTRYVKILDDGTEVHSCNKYGRCPSYEELLNERNVLKYLVNAYRNKRDVDGLNGRKWDEVEHFRAEAQIVRLENNIK